MLTRRQMLATGAALPLVPATARAASHTGTTGTNALADALRFPLGEDMAVTVLSDGALRIGPEALQGIDAEGYATLMQDAYRDPDTFRAAVNGFLVEANGEKMLIDAGTGGAMGPDLGRLLGNLSATGTAPEDITRVIATHLHPDHVGGAVEGGEAVFPNAELTVHEQERAFWTEDVNMAEGSEQFFQIARTVLDQYSDRLNVISGDEVEVAPGLTSMFLPGHTPGHTGYVLNSGDQSVLIWADIVHAAPVQLARPEVTIGFDVNPEQAAETRAALLDRVVADRMMIAGSHIDFPGMGHIAPEGEGYRMVNAAYPYRA